MRRTTTTCVAFLILAAACGTDDTEAEDAAADAEEEHPETTILTVELVSTSGTISQNHDDEFCIWFKTSYAIRDGDGSVLAAGDAESTIDGEATVGGESAEVGVVEATRPDYRCTMKFRVEVEETDFYDIEVTTERAPLGAEEFTASELVPLEDARGGVTIEFSR